MISRILLFSAIVSFLFVSGCRPGDSAKRKFAAGFSAYRDGNYAAATAAFSEAANTQHAPVETLYLLGVSRLRQGELDAASAAFHEALKSRPGHGESLAGLGEIAYHHQQFDDALRYYGQALRAKLSTEEARAAVLNGIALVYSMQKNPPLCRLHLLQAQHTAPKYAPTYYNLGAFYRDTYKLYEEAKDQFSLFLTLAEKKDPKAEAAKKNITRLDAVIRRNAPKPPEQPVNNEAFNKLLEAGSEAQARHDYARAIYSFQEAIKKDPRSFTAQWGLAMACKNRGKNIEALEAFRAAARLNPTHQACYANAATLAFLLKKYDVVENVLDTALARSPFNAATMKQTALLYSYQGRKAECVAYGKFYLSLLKKDAGDPTFEKWLEKNL